VCDLETSRMGAPYMYDISHLRVNLLSIKVATCFDSKSHHEANLKHGSLIGLMMTP